MFPPRPGEGKDVHSYYFFSTQCQKPQSYNEATKRSARDTDQKEKKKLPLFSQDMITQKIPKNLLPKTTPRTTISEISKLIRYKINIQNVIAINECNEYADMEIKNTMTFTIAQK